MPRQKLDKDVKRAILDTRRIVQEAEKADVNEAETRRRVERIFESIMGYDAFKHLSRERAIRGAGETEHVDFAIQIEEGEDAKPQIMVEIKRVGVALAPKHLKQVSSYAINAGCEWILLTNSRVWKLYHVAFGQPPITKLIKSWDLVSDELPVIARSFQVVSYKNVRKGKLDDLWEKTNVLHPRNLLQAILSQNSISILRRELKKGSGVTLSPEDILSGVRRLLNETALIELESLRLCLDDRKSRRPRRKKEEKGAQKNQMPAEEEQGEPEIEPEDDDESVPPSAPEEGEN